MRLGTLKRLLDLAFASSYEDRSGGPSKLCHWDYFVRPNLDLQQHQTG